MLGILIVVGAAASLSWSLFVAAGEAARDPGKPQPRRSPQRCPYCKSGVRVRVHRCPGCATIHHAECWEEHAGCSIYGCSEAGQTTRANRPGAAEATEPQPELPEADSLSAPADPAASAGEESSDPAPELESETEPPEQERPEPEALQTELPAPAEPKPDEARPNPPVVTTSAG